MPDKPAVTDEHLKKYQSIMGTAVGGKPADSSTSIAPPAPNSPAANQKNPFANFVPKVTGLGNKMFIFTGKKKIIIDGSERAEEKVKTVNPKAEKHIEEKVVEKAPTPPPPPKPAKIEEVIHVQGKTPPPVATSTSAPMGNAKKEAIVPQKKEETKTEKKTSTGGKKIPTALLVVFAIIFIAAWTLFWLVFFGYIKF